MKYQKIKNIKEEEKVIYIAMNNLEYSDIRKEYINILETEKNDIVLGNMVEGLAVIARRFGIFDYNILEKILLMNNDSKYIKNKLVDLKDDFSIYFNIYMKKID